ncbi:hypothetical protein [Mesorhizobium sp. M0058]|uniref:hypothetical protein n=1 Tax=Mesorhizobium sp. M0058 TaxID=2956865 RepID=UPI003337A7BB
MISICVYGSQARNRTDQFSDRDVLMVARCSQTVEDYRRHWEASGWNVSFFTCEHFERLVDFKSLFIQHLKLEGLIIRDDEAFLQRRLTNFQPAQTYIEELKDALLPATWENGEEANYWADLCLGDILFVAMRNAAILHSATSGKHIYDYKQLIDHVTAAFRLTRLQRAALLGLRTMKAAYRSRRHGVELGTILPQAIGAMQNIRNVVLPLRDVSTTGFVPNNYHALRKAELDLVRFHDPRYLDKLDPSEEAYGLWQLVCNPADYPKMRAAPRAVIRPWLSYKDAQR